MYVNAYFRDFSSCNAVLLIILCHKNNDSQNQSRIFFPDWCKKCLRKERSAVLPIEFLSHSHINNWLHLMVRNDFFPQCVLIVNSKRFHDRIAHCLVVTHKWATASLKSHMLVNRFQAVSSLKDCCLIWNFSFSLNTMFKNQSVSSYKVTKVC